MATGSFTVVTGAGNKKIKTVALFRCPRDAKCALREIKTTCLCAPLSGVVGLSKVSSTYQGSPVNDIFDVPLVNGECKCSVCLCMQKRKNVCIDSRGRMRLVDFGLVKKTIQDARRHTKCGSVQCFALEVLKEDLYGFPTEVFGIGVIIFEVLTDLDLFSLSPSGDHWQEMRDIHKRADLSE
uniref:Protein kinase domain-containing protein n=1 Tax=Chromera velia CCMP2878 TaxID=1169474 RepID=A0A0G4FFX3_9ALVE|eukprot:Cvel_16763.t1-p1 / transcript=Cvel_16763.t1 / gene=Cvel_16763 / organism=Chromera_velia_CCMP2878 / gene_product=Protein kinase C-like 3, putative / transcript_product=Protein kinase C-like 3, putative / location=Cvel_scaffold1307:26959-28387(+) / protein_length=181 / sequence_SO=supercontig / SO=protein_coding / is_pseudo=false